MEISRLIREILYLTGYYSFQFRRLLNLPNTKIGHLLFSIHRPEKVDIKAKLLGASGIRSEPVKINKNIKESLNKFSRTPVNMR